LTNVDLDHLDEHGSFDGIVESFDAYLAEVPGPKVVCIDDPVAATLADTYGAVTYGVGAGNWSADRTAAPGTTPTSDGSTPTSSGNEPSPDVWAADIVHHADGTTFEVCEGAARHRAVLPLRGLHNVRNLLAAFAMARQLGVDATVALDAVKQFSGVRRRFEVRAHDGGATFVDDYAHLPAEIAAVLASVRAGGTEWKRVLAVFQPNRFNRMAVMSDAYSDAFIDADVIAITDIYASGTDRIDGVSGRLVVDAVRRAHPHARVEWCQERESLIDFVAREAQAGDVCISMGCGDIETFPDEVVARRRDLSRGS